MKLFYNFKKKYNVSIEESGAIDLCSKNIGDNSFNDLSKIKLKIIILDLSSNKISNISPLKSDNFKYLQKLYLCENEIEDLTCLNNLRLDYLLELKLWANKIVDITPLKNVIFKKIKILDLSNNKISEIGILKKT